MRLLVCGGRDYADRASINTALNAIHRKRGVKVLIHGDAPGADSLAASWAEDHGVAVEPYRADWKRHGRAAGPLRNARMLTEGRPDAVCAFPGGKGTTDMVRRAREAGIRVWEPYR